MTHGEYKSAHWQKFMRPNKDTPIGTLLFYSGHGGNVTYVLLSHITYPDTIDSNGKTVPRLPEWQRGGMMLCLSAKGGRPWIDERAFPDKLALFPETQDDYVVQIAGDPDRIGSR